MSLPLQVLMQLDMFCKYYRSPCAALLTLLMRLKASLSLNTELQALFFDRAIMFFMFSQEKPRKYLLELGNLILEFIAWHSPLLILTLGLLLPQEHVQMHQDLSEYPLHPISMQIGDVPGPFKD